MNNFYITNDLKLKKIYGYKSFYNFETQIKGMYPTNLGGTEYLLVATDSKLYYFTKSQLEDEDNWDTLTPTLIGTIGTGNVSFFTFDKKVYILSGKYHSWDGTTLKEVEGYVPLVFINTPPAGGGLIYDEINLLTGKKHQTFNGDGSSKDFYIAQQNVTSIDKVLVNNDEIKNLYQTQATSDNDINFVVNDNGTYNITGTASAQANNYLKVDLSTTGLINGEKYTFSCNQNLPSGIEIMIEGFNDNTWVRHVLGAGKKLNSSTNELTGTANLDTITKIRFTIRIDLGVSVNISNLGIQLERGEQKTQFTKFIDYVYTYNLSDGKVSFVNAPQQAMDNVDIYWTLDDGDRNIIEGMKFGTVFGGDLDTRVFLYGNSNCQNRAYFSGLEEGVPSVEYFPATAQVDIGPSNFELTDLTRQYDRLIATTNRPEAYYLTIGTEELNVVLSDMSTTTRLVPSVATYPLNEIHGNVAPGQGQLIDNYPVTIDKNALIMWKATNVRDEKNMEDISQKIRLDLSELDLSKYKTLDHQADNQLWFGHNKLIYIYNYFNKTYSRLRIEDNLQEFADLNNYIYMGTDTGKLVKWSEFYQDFDGKTINSHWEMDFSDFGEAYLRKTMNRLWVLMQPQGSSSADIGYITNRNESATKKHIEYKVQVLDDVDFSNFSFKISSNPQPFRLKMKAKKFTNLKITIDNTEKTDCTILQLILKVESFGESK